MAVKLLIPRAEEILILSPDIIVLSVKRPAQLPRDLNISVTDLAMLQRRRAILQTGEFGNRQHCARIASACAGDQLCLSLIILVEVFHPLRQLLDKALDSLFVGAEFDRIFGQ